MRRLSSTQSRPGVLNWLGFVLLALLIAAVYTVVLIIGNVGQVRLMSGREVRLPFILMATGLLGWRIVGYKLGPRRLWIGYLILVAAAMLAIPVQIRPPADDFMFFTPYAAFSPHRPGTAGLRDFRLNINHDTRSCLGLPANHNLTMRARIPERGALFVGAGVTKNYFHPKEKLALEVLIKEGASSPRVVGRVELGRDRSQWRDVKIDLNSWSGQEVTLIFQARGPTHSGEESLIYFSSPLLARDNSDRKQPNVIFILVDTLRADAVSFDPERPGETPNFARLARRGVVFQRHYAQSSWTLPSVASIFTSQMPIQTGSISGQQTRLLETQLTLAELVRSGGWRTGAVVSNRLIRGDNQFDQGFDTLVNVQTPLQNMLTSGEDTNREALSWLDKNQDAPFFLFLMYTDPHNPYLPPLKFLNQPQANRLSLLDVAKAMITFGPRPLTEAPLFDYSTIYHDLYRAEVRYWDYCLGRLLDDLERRDLLSNTLLVIGSDHGEEFLEHEFWGHGFTLYEEVVHVPLLVVDGRGLIEPGEVDVVTQNLDLFPTIAEYLGLPTPPDRLGVSLWPLLKGETDKYRGKEALTELPIAALYRLKLPSWAPIDENIYLRAMVGQRLNRSSPRKKYITC